MISLSVSFPVIILPYNSGCKFSIFLCTLIMTLSSCSDHGSVSNDDQFVLNDEIEIRDNTFNERIFRNELFEIRERIAIPEYIGDIYQLRAGIQGIYLNDRNSVYRYKDGHFEVVVKPMIGEGPNEIEGVFRFDVHASGNIAIAGYPGNRIMSYYPETDSISMIETRYRGNVLMNREGNIYGRMSSPPSGHLFTKFSIDGDSLRSFGKLFSNQDISMNMFDLYWDYNEKHDAIVVGFMYVGYYAVINSDGSVRYVVESPDKPGEFPPIVQRGNWHYVDTEGRTMLRDLTTNEDEIHVFRANATDRGGDVYGAVIDVLDVRDGTYSFSYILNEPLHWPIVLLNDGSVASVTRDYELVIWKRIEEAVL